VLDRPTQRAQIPIHDLAVGASQCRVRFEGVGRQQRTDQAGHQQRHEYRHRHGESKLDEELADQPAQKADGQKYRDNGTRARHHREADLIRRIHRGLIRALPHFHVPRDVLHFDDGIVDQDPGDERQREQRHLIEGEAEPLHEGEGGQRRERNRQGGDDRGTPVAQEQHDDHDREQGAFDQRLDR
jgi:hypothetical protein